VRSAKEKKMSVLHVAFDTETGGLNENKADLLTAYFAIMTEDYQIIDELDLKLKPNDRLPIAEAGALAANKIDLRAHMADPETITYAEGQKKLETLLKKHLKRNGRYSNLVPMGYNILGFDIRWLQKHLLPQDVWISLMHYKNWDVMQDVDALKRWTWFPANLGSLVSVVEYLNVPTRNAHNAKEDTLMTIDVAKKIAEIMKSKKDGGGNAAGTDLIALLEAE
jgi:DNA polymerase III epsilon subunit-like protein